MKKLYVMLSIAAAIFTQSFLWQQQPEFTSGEEALFKEHKCRMCHKIEKNKIGPAYFAVAQKYSNTENAISMIKASIKNGGSGKWGKKTMPEYKDLDDATLTQMATAILNLKHN